MTTAREVLRCATGLPTLSGVVAKLSRLKDDEKAKASDFERIVTPDPALTANLLRLANSPFFGARRQIQSVRQAIALLGIERVFEVAVSASFSQVLPERIPGFNISARDFFKHSFAVGAMAEQLAKQCEVKTEELIFTAGLLHDIGKLAIGALLLEHAAALLAEIKADDVPFIDSEQQLVGTNHTEVGELMVETWDLPNSIGLAARWHHHPDALENAEGRQLAYIVHIADCLSHMMGFGVDVGELKRELNSHSMKRLKLKVGELESVALETTEQIAEMGEIIGGH
jgi:putative nucleotidyltransferase with HDIG domain